MTKKFNFKDFEDILIAPKSLLQFVEASQAGVELPFRGLSRDLPKSTVCSWSLV